MPTYAIGDVLEDVIALHRGSLSNCPVLIKGIGVFFEVLLCLFRQGFGYEKGLRR